MSGDRNERDGIEKGIRDAGDQIGRARTGGRETHPDFSGGARKSLRGKNRTLFVPSQNVIYFRGITGERVIKRQNCPPGVAENCVDALGNQTFEDDL